MVKATTEQPVWPRTMPVRAVFLGTLSGQMDLYVIPREFPLSAMLVSVTGLNPQDVTLLQAKQAVEQGYPYWEVAALKAIRAGLMQAWEILPNNDFMERECEFAEMPWRGFLIPACADDRWDPEVHGVEVGDDCDEPVISWRPGRYSFSAHSGASGSWEMRIDGERGSVPPTEPAQDVLQAMHVFIAALRDRL